MGGIKGLDQLKQKLERLKRNAQSLGGQVPVKDLLTPAFLQANTRFTDLTALVAASGLTDDEFANDTEKRDTFIRTQTSYPSWHDLLQAAVPAYAKQKLFS